MHGHLPYHDEITESMAAVATATAPPPLLTLHPSHHDDAASKSSSRTQNNKTRGETEEECGEDEPAVELVASPVAVVSPAIVDESLERTSL